MAQRLVNSDAIAAELRDSQAAHKKIQKLPFKNLKSEFEVQKVGSSPNDKNIQLQKGPQSFLEWLVELDPHYNIERYYASEQNFRKNQNLEVEGYSIWYRKHIIELSKLKKYYEDEQGNIPVPPSSPQKKEQKRGAWYQNSAEFYRSQSQKKRR